MRARRRAWQGRARCVSACLLGWLSLIMGCEQDEARLVAWLDAASEAAREDPGRPGKVGSWRGLEVRARAMEVAAAASIATRFDAVSPSCASRELAPGEALEVTVSVRLESKGRASSWQRQATLWRANELRRGYALKETFVSGSDPPLERLTRMVEEPGVRHVSQGERWASDEDAPQRAAQRWQQEAEALEVLEALVGGWAREPGQGERWRQGKLRLGCHVAESGTRQDALGQVGDAIASRGMRLEEAQLEERAPGVWYAKARWAASEREQLSVELWRERRAVSEGDVVSEEEISSHRIEAPQGSAAIERAWSVKDGSAQ